MKTVDKAALVLDQFTVERKEIGLSELARLINNDKAATRRLLLALSKHELIEQDEETRKYRLGKGFLRLARVREATVPLSRAAQKITDWLAHEVGETVHVSVPMAEGMNSVAHCMPNRGHVINIYPSQVLPFDATSSGLSFLAFSSIETQKSILAMKRTRATPESIRTNKELIAKIKQIQADGYVSTRSLFEEEVASVGMPFFVTHGEPAGAVAIAVPESTFDNARIEQLLIPLRQEVARLENELTGS